MDKAAKTILDGLTKKDEYILTISRKEKDQIKTYCLINEFPTGDLPMAREDISTLIHNTYLKDTTASSDLDEKIKSILEEEKEEK